ncbi:MAG TPA: polynucleotide kinase-phosphatase [Nocardioides sp.]|uniref:polynucleotide kinase-phosphatase n=1 Tax=uncultured Nocardioides sp. TaxID=198441 RepID=UPI000EE38B30|nr:polynucleotide kinase-phosphatase [uncultured Nocardioides sp.]HCB06908.1 polynucleotide kinase-phosphatase [Nocardioides sp.]HRD62220.1 polynucleotide kinase-phosphatase [Nocardioides sp.]HRI97086.1 polynucleotide kinase-phosphatase [Nocardioides sp.]
MAELKVPALGLVVLVGVSGSGKSTFAARHFDPWAVVSSDHYRGVVANDPTDQAATKDAFDVLGYVVSTRLRRGLLTVVDATSVQRSARQQLVRLAKEHDVLVDAIVLDVPEQVAQARNSERPDRDFGPHVVARQVRDLRKSLRGIRKEGFRRVHVLTGVEEIEKATVATERSWNDRTELTGPFDVIGDVHGCRSELDTLLDALGWAGTHHPEGRTALFVGDLVDRGPDTPGVLRRVMAMVEAGTALCVSGNHEAKLVRALKGAQVQVTHGLEESLEQLAAESEEFRAEALAFMDGLISHYILDGGRLVVAHAGLKEAYHGRASGRVRSFALYGDTTGETDEYGLPVRYPWARDYRGQAMVVYGHTPVPEAEWVNNTICLDTGVVFGGKLTALRYPEREIVSVPAEQQWYEPARPLVAEPIEREPTALAIDDVIGERWLEAPYAGKVKVPAENAAAALEVMSRFAVDPRWLVYLPATMSPATSSTRTGLLEHPEQAFDDYVAMGVTSVVCEEKHMGSRAVAVLAREAEAAERRFGVADGTTGVVYTRTGRPFFDSSETMTELVARLRAAAAPLFERLDTDWLVLDGELLPWSAKALGLIRGQYAAVGAAARHALPALGAVLDTAAARGLDVRELAARSDRRLAHAQAFRDAYAAYCRPTDGLDGVTFAPFQILAGEGRVSAATETHAWHLEHLALMAGADLITSTRHRFVELGSAEQRADAAAWWEELTAAGGEGMVVKPAHLTDGRVQPGLKVRGREYLRIIYGPDYTDSLDLLRQRHLGKKRELARREHGLGLDSLTAFVAGEPLWRVHQLVFAVLALESEPVDPRL